MALFEDQYRQYQERLAQHREKRALWAAPKPERPKSFLDKPEGYDPAANIGDQEYEAMKEADPSAADLEEMNAAFKRIDAENEYDERSDG